jgi:hypothetical protein
MWVPSRSVTRTVPFLPRRQIASQVSWAATAMISDG